MSNEILSPLYAPEAELIVASVAMRPRFDDERDQFLNDTIARCFAPSEDGESLSERIYRAGLIRQGNRYLYASTAAMSDYLSVPRSDLQPYFQCFNLPVHEIQAAVDRIIEAAQRRSYQKHCNSLIAKVQLPERSIESLISDGLSRIAGIAVVSKDPGLSGSDIVSQYGKAGPWDRYPKLFVWSGGSEFTATPFLPGVVNLFPAAPFTGKTVAAWWYACEFAKAGGRILWLGWEMTATDLLDMLITRITGIDYKSLVMARMLPEDFALAAAETAAVKAALESIADWIGNIRFLTGQDAGTLNEVYSYVRQLRVKGEIDLLVIDHLNIAKVDDERGRRIVGEFELPSAASKWCMQIAADTGTPIWANLQLNRSRKDATSEGGGPLQYTKEMLRGSGHLEQDAWGITALQTVLYNPRTAEVRHHDGNDDTVPEGWEKAIHGQVLKNRMGGRLGSWTLPIIPNRYDYRVNTYRAAEGY
jgi:hypothetical protein